MTATDHEVEVLQPDGSTTVERRTLWASEYGPIIDFPGFGWTDTTTLTYRDANLDNDEFAEQYIGDDGGADASTSSSPPTVTTRASRCSTPSP